MKKYEEWICRYYASHADIPSGEQDGALVGKIIRCKDCKFLRFTGTVWKCQNRLVMMLCEPNDYCSRGERKEE